MRVILAVAVLGFSVVTVTLARQQPVEAAEHNQHQRDRQVQAGIGPAAALRGQVAKLRAEVELLELEREVDKALLLEMLKQQRSANSDVKRAATAREAIDQAMMTAACFGKLDEFKKEFGDGKTLLTQAEKELKEQDERAQADIERQKRAFVRLVTDLNEKRFALAEREKELFNTR